VSLAAGSPFIFPTGSASIEEVPRVCGHCGWFCLPLPRELRRRATAAAAGPLGERAPAGPAVSVAPSVRLSQAGCNGTGPTAPW